MILSEVRLKIRKVTFLLYITTIEVIELKINLFSSFQDGHMLLNYEIQALQELLNILSNLLA